jgi:hypothetical protein
VAKVIEYDVTGVEESSGGTGVKVKPGVRIARIDLCEQREEKADGSPANDLRVGLNFGSEFDWGFTYIGLGPASDWKLAEFVRSLKLKDKGKLDPDKAKGKFVRVKVNNGTYQGEYSPDMGKLFPPKPGDEKLWAANEGGVSETSTSTAAAGPDEEPEEAAAAEADGFVPTREDENDEEVGLYDDWSDEDLLAEAEDRKLTLPGGRGSKKDKAIKALRADDEEAAAAPEPDEPAADGDTPDADDYDDWDVDALEKEWKEREMGDLPVVKGRNREARYKAQMIEDLRQDDVDNPFDG